MKRPTITDAKTICERIGARAVIVIALYPDNFAGASYGETKRECGQTGYTLDRIMEEIQSGGIPVWRDRQ